MTLAIKALAWGFGVAVLHLILSIVLAVYFGLGMSPTGAAFLEEVVLQPGTGVSRALCDPGAHCALGPPIVNFVFYWTIGAVVARLVYRILEGGMR